MSGPVGSGLTDFVGPGHIGPDSQDDILLIKRVIGWQLAHAGNDFIPSGDGSFGKSSAKTAVRTGNKPHFFYGSSPLLFHK